MKEHYNQKPYHREERFYHQPYQRPYSKSYKFGKKPHRPRRRGMQEEHRFFAGLLSGLYQIISYPFRRWKQRPEKINQVDILERWQGAAEMIKRGGPANFKTAILEMDKTFSEALAQAGFEGEHFGERLKNAKRIFGEITYGELWQAHKARNKVVHEINYEVTSFETLSVKRKFEKGMKELKIF